MSSFGQVLVPVQAVRSGDVVQELIEGPGEPIEPGEYLGNGNVHEFRYGKDLGRVFRHEKLASMHNFGEAWGYVPSGKAGVFVDNHDTQRSGGDILTYKDNGMYALANAFMLAWPYGTPSVMSSFEFDKPDQGPPSDASGKTNDATCFAGGWRCEHRRRVIANMVGFHNGVEGTPDVHWFDDGKNHIAFGRGNRGYLTINNSDQTVTGRRYQSDLPAGRYCDVIHGDVAGGSCTVGELFRTIGRHVPPPPGLRSPIEWGRKQRLSGGGCYGLDVPRMRSNAR